MRNWSAGTAIFLSALALRLALLFSLGGTPFEKGLFYDSLLYSAGAERILGGESLSDTAYYLDPLYSYFLALLSLLFGGSIFAVRLVQAVMGACSALLAGWIGTEISGDRRVGVLAGFGTATYDLLIYYDLQILKTATEIFLGLLVTVFALWARRSGSRPVFFLTGLVLGLAILTHGSYLLLPPALALWLFLAREPKDRRVLARALLPLLGGTAIVILPVTARNAVYSGDFVLTTYNGGMNFYEGNNPEADGAYHRPAFYRGEPLLEESSARDEAFRRAGRTIGPAEVSSFWFREAFRWIGDHPLRWLRLLGRKFLLSWNRHEVADNFGYEFSRLFLPFLSLPLPGFALWGSLGLAGMLICLGSFRQWSLAYFFVGTQTAAMIIFHVVDRYRLPSVPFLIVFGSAALVATWDAMRRRDLRRFAALTGIIAAGAAFVNLPHFYDAQQVFAQPYHVLARHYLEKGDMSRAQELCLASLDVDPGYGLAHDLLGKILLSSERSEEARGHFQEAVRTGFVRADPLFGEGMALLHMGKTEEAKEAFGRLARGGYGEMPDFWGDDLARRFLDIPDEGRGLFLLGAEFEAAGLSGEAERAYRRAMEAAPSLPGPHAAYGNLLLESGRAVEAVAWAKKGIGAAAGTEEVHLVLARAYLAIGNPRQALRSLQEGATSRQDAGIYWETRGKVLDALGDVEGAIAAYRRSWTSSADGNLPLRLATLLLQEGRTAEAEGVLREVIGRTEKKAEAYNLLGVSLGLQGRSEEALEVFSRAVVLDPYSEVFRANLEKEAGKRQGREGN